MRAKIERVEDLEVFRRAYRLSLEIHRVEPGVSADRAICSGRPAPAGPRNRFAPTSPRASPSRVILRAELSALPDDGDRSAATRRSCGCATASISAISRKIVGRRMERRLREISRMLQGLYASWQRSSLIPNSWFLAPDAVAERSVGRRSKRASACGGIGSANADMSSVNEGEKPSRRKSKGSCARLIRAGLAGPLRRGREP